jgi:hypothetical protein
MIFSNIRSIRLVNVRGAVAEQLTHDPKLEGSNPTTGTAKMFEY